MHEIVFASEADAIRKSGRMMFRGDEIAETFQADLDDCQRSFELPKYSSVNYDF